MNPCLAFFKLVFLVSLSAGRNIANASNPSDRLILIHNRNCKVDASIASALAVAQTFAENEVPLFEEKLAAQVPQTREERLRMSPANEARYVGRRLSEMDMEERRDEVVAALTLMIKAKLPKEYGNHTQASAAGSSSPVSFRHLRNVGMDIVYTDALPKNEVKRLASKLPCLAHPPQENKVSYPAKAPNDWKASKQWYLDSNPVGIGAKEAWACYNGQRNGPVIAVLDTGCTPQPDLERNLCSCKEDCFGFDAAYRKNPHNENFVHGTPVSGAIAAVSNNNYGLAGVCWGCRIMCVKTADDQGLFHSEGVVSAIDFVLSKQDMVKITNHSYVAYGRDTSEEVAYKDLRDAGILAVAAAGNDSCDMDRYRTEHCVQERNGVRRKVGDERPAGLELDNIISVGASDRKGLKASFSNYGKTQVDLFAPGADILSLCNTKKQKCQMEEVQGTSIASPIVAGAAALIWGQKPTLTYKEVKEILMKTVRKVKALEPYCVSGGILNLQAAMEKVTPRSQCSTPSYDIIPTPKGDRTADYYGDDFCDKTPEPTRNRDDDETPKAVPKLRKPKDKRSSSMKSNCYSLFPSLIIVLFLVLDCLA